MTSDSETRKLERELLLGEKKVEKLVEKMGNLGFLLRGKLTEARKKSLENKLRQIEKEKEKLEKDSEKIVLKLCEVGDDDDDGDWPQGREDEEEWMTEEDEDDEDEDEWDMMDNKQF